MAYMWKQNSRWSTTYNFCDSCTGERGYSYLWMSLLCNIWELRWIHSKRYVEFCERGWLKLEAPLHNSYYNEREQQASSRICTMNDFYIPGTIMHYLVGLILKPDSGWYQAVHSCLSLSKAVYFWIPSLFFSLEHIVELHAIALRRNRVLHYVYPCSF